MNPVEGVKDLQSFITSVVEKKRRPKLPDTIPSELRRFIKKSWAQNPDKRLSFAEILNKLDDIIIDVMISDHDGRALWKSLSKKKKMKEHYPFFVAWDSLATALFSTLGHNLANDDTASTCLQLMLGAQYQDATASAQKTKVEIEEFANFLECFGPLILEKTNEDIISGFKSICAQKWFHGKIGMKEAGDRLRGEKEGSFLVRMSANASGVTISRVAKKKGIVHQRAIRKNGYFAFQVKKKELQRFETLPELLQGIASDLDLKYPCGNSRVFAFLFDAVVTSSGEYLEFAKD